jgi:hypothetical protein
MIVADIDYFLVRTKYKKEIVNARNKSASTYPPNPVWFSPSSQQDNEFRIEKELSDNALIY